MGYLVVGLFLGFFAVLAAGALALQVIGLTGRAPMLERAGKQTGSPHLDAPRKRP